MLTLPASHGQPERSVMISVLLSCIELMRDDRPGNEECVIELIKQMLSDL